MKYREKKSYKYVVEETYIKELHLDEYPNLDRECDGVGSMALENAFGERLGGICRYAGTRCSTMSIQVNPGYTWDGCSGPTVDTANTMAAGLVHDFLYQMVREGIISKDCKEDIDNLFHSILRECGVIKIRAWYYHEAVKRFGHSSLESKVIEV